MTASISTATRRGGREALAVSIRTATREDIPALAALKAQVARRAYESTHGGRLWSSGWPRTLMRSTTATGSGAPATMFWLPPTRLTRLSGLRPCASADPALT